MSSIITIGFLDRTRVCIQTEFTPPLADDERRELLIHATMLTGRAFAALSPARQGALAGVLREWIAARFATCPLQIVDGDPMACPHRFASTFLAPVREYALATIGCNGEAGGIDYFLPMAAAAYLRHVAVTDHDPEELLKPALALCAAATIHPITVDNHFQMAAASLPKIEPVVDRTGVAEAAPAEPAENSHRHLRETRRSLIVSACLAALMIVLGVQFLSTRDPKAGGEPAAVRSDARPKAVPQQSRLQPLPPIPPTKSSPGLRAVVNAPPKGQLTKPPSPKARAYLRTVRDLAENSLAQVEVMLAAADRKGMVNDDPSETLDYGTRQLQSWRHQVAALAPPEILTEQHQEIGRIMIEMGRIAQAILAQPPKPDSGAIRDRLDRIHGELARVLNQAEAF
nr:hypothetical protein [Nitrospirota bacterium]